MAIFVIGLGPGDAELLTLRAKRFLDAAAEMTPHVYVRTRHHPAVAALPPAVSVIALADLPDASPEVAAQFLVEKARSESVVYAVPGHPLVGEPAVLRLLELARAEQIPVEVIGGVSFIGPSCRLLQRDLLDSGGVQIAAANELVREYYPRLDPDRPTLIANAVDVDLSALQQKLLALFPAEHELLIIAAAATSEALDDRPGHSLKTVPLGALAEWGAVGPLSTLYLPPAARASGLESFADMIAHLRAPEDGCPWDREQTPQTLRRYLLEEAYEALEAIDLNEPRRLMEELGDLLLQIVLQSQIASEHGDFRLSDVVANISAKIVRRHPHVFGDLKGATIQEIEENWEKIKRSEKEEGAEVHSFFRDIPRGLPALSEAEDMQQRAWRVGLWNGTQEDADLRTGKALNRWHAQHDMPSLGDALFMLVDQARRAGLDAESALREANQRFKWNASSSAPPLSPPPSP